MADHIAGKAVVITGAGNGFGRLTALRLGARGAKVACLDINDEAARAVAAEIGGAALGLAADVTDLAQVRRAVDAAAEAFGTVDVMVNNAGIMPLAYIADHAEAIEAWNRCIDINVKGLMNGCVAVHDRMLAQGRGHVVNLSSIYGNHPFAGGAVYGATKAAVDYFSHALRQETRGAIKVTVIKPTGVMATGLGDTVVNREAGAPIVGHNAAAFYAGFASYAAGEGGPMFDADCIEYAFLAPEHIADAIVHVIDQPWGVAISDVTVRAAGDHYIA